MRKSKKLLSILLSVCMLASLMPSSAFAAGSDAPSVFDLGDPEAPFKLNIVNDADAKMRYEITLNGKTQTTAIDANGTLSIGVNVGDKYKVTKIGNPNYRSTEESIGFLNEADGYNAVINNGFSHKFGDGFKTGEDISFFLNSELEGGIPYIGQTETKTIGGESRVLVKGSYKSYAAAPGSYSKTGATITFKDGNTNIGSTKASADFTTVSQAAVDKAVPALQTAADAYFEGTVKPLYTTGNEADREYVYAVYTGKYTPKSGCDEAKVEYGVSGSYQIFIPLTEKVVDIVDPLTVGDITLTFTADVEAKVGGVSVDVLNNERLAALNSNIDANFIIQLLDSGILSGLMGGEEKPAEEGDSSVDAIVSLLESGTFDGLIGVAALDNMPNAFNVTLTEIDENDGLYEGLVYSVPYKSRVFLKLDIDAILKDGLGNLYSLVSGSLPENLQGLVLTIPLSFGATFALDGIREGKYQMNISDPGDGWYAHGTSSFTVTVKEGQIATDFGGKQQAGIIALKTIAPKLLDMVGCGGCSGMLGMCSTIRNGSLKIFNQSGVVFDHSWNKVEFTNADLVYTEGEGVKTVGIEGSEFLLADRDQLLALSDSLLALGEGAVNGIVGGIDFESLLKLNGELAEGDEEIESDQSTINKLLVSVLAMGDRLGGLKIPAILEATGGEEGLVSFSPYNNITLAKLCELIPKVYHALNSEDEAEQPVEEPVEPELLNAAAPKASVMAADAPAPTAEGTDAASALGIDIGDLDMATVMELLSAIADGESIDAILELLDQIKALGKKEEGEDPDQPDPDQPGPDQPGPDQPGPDQPGPDQPGPDQPDQPEEPEGPDTVAIVMELIEKFGGGDLGLALVNILGLSEGRFPTGNYVLIQTAVPEGRILNPMMYVFNNTWNGAERKYHTYASVDVADVMSNEQFAAFAEQLAAQSEKLNEIFGELALSADAGLGIIRTFLGEGESYDSDALLIELERILSELNERMKPEEPPVEEPPVEEQPVEQPVEEQPVEEQPVEEPKITEEELRAALAGIIDNVMETYLPKAAVISYAANLVYRIGGDLFESPEEAAAVLMSMLENKELTFTSLFDNVNALLDTADFVVNGEVTKDWYYYNLSEDVFSNVTVVFHYVLGELLPPELAAVVERALADDFEQTGELVDEFIDELVPGEEEVPAEEEAPTEETPAEEESGDDRASGWFDFFGRLIRFFGNL